MCYSGMVVLFPYTVNIAHNFNFRHDKMSELVPPAKYQQFLEYQTAMAKANGNMMVLSLHLTRNCSFN